MHTISLRSMALLAAVEVGLLSAQNTVPTFDQYRVTEPKFSGKPMLPQDSGGSSVPDDDP